MGKSRNEGIAQNGLQVAANLRNGLLTGEGIAAKYTLKYRIEILLTRYKN